MHTTNLFINLVADLSLVMMLLGSTTIAASASKDDELKADPRLMQMAEEHPAATICI